VQDVPDRMDANIFDIVFSQLQKRLAVDVVFKE
jgi:hypothetical protein